MEILVTVLKILGIILLIILGSITAILLLILFVPIRYRAKGNLDSGEKPNIEARVTWLLHFIRLTVTYSEKPDISLKILGIRIFSSSGKKESISQTESRDNVEIPDEPETDKDNLITAETENLKASDNNVIIPEPRNDDEVVDEKPSGIIDKIDYLIEKILLRIEQFQENTETAIQNLILKIEDLKSKYDYYMGIITEDSTMAYISKAFGVIRKILTHIIPKKLSADMEIGTGDPSSTAYILAIHGMLYPLIGENIKINADFEKKCAAGNFFLKGRIYICVILYQTLRLVLDRRLFALIKQLKKGGNK